MDNNESLAALENMYLILGKYTYIFMDIIIMMPTNF